MTDALQTDLKVGDPIPPLVVGPISRHTLALFAGGSGDSNPIHVDVDFAKAAGAPDVFAHGMLSMAYVGRLLTEWRPQASLLSWNVRFLSITPLHATVTAYGEVAALEEVDGRRCARLSIGARTDGGMVTLGGEAVVRL